MFDNLVEGSELGMAFFDRVMLPLLAEFPRSLTDIKVLFKELFDNGLGLSEHDIEQYVSKLWQVMISGDERRMEDYQRIAWWDFIQADQQSEAFRKIFPGLTRMLVAAKAREANTATIGTVTATLMMDIVTPGTSSDRLLNGPTNEVWIEPWLAYLQSLGVDYHLEAKVEAIHCKDGVIQGVTINEHGVIYEAAGDYYISALPVEIMAPLLSEEMLKADPTLASIQTLSQSVEWMNGIQFFLNIDVPVIHGHVIYMDSPWALTSVSQKQFWPDIDLSQYGDGTVQGILSVDVSDWNEPGILYGKTAMECTPEEIKTRCGNSSSEA